MIVGLDKLKDMLEEVNLAVEFVRNHDGSISGRSRTRGEAAQLALDVVRNWLILMATEAILKITEE